MPDWLRLFPDSDHRLQMSLRPGDAKRFWQRSDEAESVLAERRHWMATAPNDFVRVLPEGETAVAEAIEWIMTLLDRSPCTAEQAAVEVEPDWIVLSGDSSRSHPVVGGAVLFPSHWALADKIGRPLHEVHAPVPGLQSSLGSPITTFLSRLAPGAEWERENWGLSADPALNHHPSRPVRRLDNAATLETTWLRLEQQFLTRLPTMQAILFGIRVTNHRLDHLAALPHVASRLARLLTTMSDDVACYKGLHSARPGLISALTTASA